MSVSGLAEGFLAGFNTMDSYQRGQKEDARQERELGLRDAMWQNAQEQQKKDDVRYEDETKYNRGRHKVDDDRWNLEYAGRQKQLELDNKRANAMLSLNVEQNKRAQESHALAVAKNKITPEQDALLNHEYAAGRNPFRVFGDPQWHQRADAVYQGMKGIINNPDAKVWDMGKMHGAINTPEIKKSLTYMVRNNLEKGIGTMTPDGVVKSYGEVEVVPTGRGTFYMQAPVTYVNPKTGEEVVKDAPITEGRTGDPRDPVKEFTPQNFIQHFGKARQVSQQIQKNPEQWENYLVQTGMKPQADFKGHKQASVDLIKELNKNVANVLSSDAVGSLEERQAQAKQLLASYEEDQAKIDSIYGVSNGAAPDESSGDTPQAGVASQWASQDPVRAGILDEARRNGIPIDSVKDPARLDALLAAYNKSKKASATAERVREIEGPKEPQRPSLAQARQLASANMATGSGKPPQPWLRIVPAWLQVIGLLGCGSLSGDEFGSSKEVRQAGAPRPLVIYPGCRSLRHRRVC